MMTHASRILSVFGVALLCSFTSLLGQGLALTKTSPTANATNIAPNSPIVLTFSQNVASTTVSSSTIRVFNGQDEIVPGSFSGLGTSVITFKPDKDFKAGSVISVSVTNGLYNVLGLPLTNATVFQFTIAVDDSPATFKPQLVFNNGSVEPEQLRVADLDGDGRADVIEVFWVAKEIAWFRNLGGNKFGAKQTISTEETGPYSIEVGDMDNDGDVDIVSTDVGGGVLGWYENLGGAKFSSRNALGSFGSPVDIALGDLDNDGFLDIVVSSATDDRLVWLRNKRDGTFNTGTLIDALDGVFSACVGDFNNDGRLDIAAVSYYGTTAKWYENYGGGKFSGGTTLSSSYQFGYYILPGDVDNDGDLDLLTTSIAGSAKISLFENKGGAFASEAVLITNHSARYQMYLSDVNDDGLLDILTAHQAVCCPEIGWFKNLGGLKFDTNYSSINIDVKNNTRTPVTYPYDLDGDGDLDVFAGSAGGSLVWNEQAYLAPSVQASGITWTNFTQTSADIYWSVGSGARRVVLIKDGSAVDALPSDDVTYTANNQFGKGQQLGTGNFVVYDGPGNFFTLTGLQINHTYYVRVFEYNGKPGEIRYNTTTAAANPVSKLFAPDIAIDFDNFGSVANNVTLDFGSNNIGNLHSEQLTISNAMEVPLVVSDIQLSGAPEFMLSSNVPTTPFTLDYLYSKAFSIIFYPGPNGVANGTYSGKLTITTNDPNENPFVINFSIKENSPTINVSQGATALTNGNTFDFGTTTKGTDVIKTFKIENKGQAALSVTGISAATPFTLPTGLTFPLSVGVGSFVTVDVTLDASSAGTFSKTLSIQSNDPTTPNFNIGLTGKVTAVNVPPTITGQVALTTPEETPLAITLANLTVTDPDNTYPTGFTLTVQNGTNYTHTGNTITPAIDFNGTLSVPVIVNDGAANSNVFALSVTVTPVNDPPVITAQTALTTSEETPLTILFANLTVTDPDNSYPTGFTIAIQNGVNYTHTTNTLTPAVNYNGTLTVPIVVNDGSANSNVFNLSVTVTPVNDAPAIIGQVALTTPEETALTIALSNLTVSDPDNTYPSGFTLSVQNGTNYTRTGNTITPATDFNGTLTVPVIVNDGSLNSNTFNLAVTVTPVDDPPVITGQLTLTTPESTPLTIALGDLTVSDVDNTYPTGFALSVQNGTNYTRSGNTITPITNFNGTLTVPVTVNDGALNSNVFNLVVTVTPVNGAPSITGQVALTTLEDTPITIGFGDLTVVDADSPYPSGFTLTVQNGTNYTHTGNTITPIANYNGTLTVPVIVNDGSLNSNVFNLVVTVTPVNDPPVITGQVTLTTLEESALTIVFSNLVVSDPDNTYPSGFTLTVQNGTNYTRSGNTITPAVNFNGTLTVPVFVNDGNANSNTFNLVVTVSPVNDAPTITGQKSLITPQETSLTLQLSDFTVIDPDNNYPTGFTLIIQNGANYTRSGNIITPNKGFSGNLTVPVQVNDGVTNSNVYNAIVNVSATPATITAQKIVNMIEDDIRTLTLNDLVVTDPSGKFPSGFILNVSSGSNYTVSGTTVIPSPNFNGKLSVPVTVENTAGKSNVFSLTINVIPVNDPPVITGQQTLTTTVSTPLTIHLTDLIVTDVDNNYPQDFTLEIANGNNYSFSGDIITPEQDFTGVLTVPVQVNDGIDASNIFNLSISVIQGNASILIKEEGSGEIKGDNIRFEPAEVGSENERQIIIANNGDGPLNILDIQFDVADFSLKDGLPSSIPPGGEAKVTLNFVPSKRGAITGRMTITSNGSQPEVTLELEGSGVAEIEVFNVVTTNQNGKHDFLKIRNIQYYPGNHVQIYTRWGEQVFSINNYDNQEHVFRGKSDGGKDMADGTYYYLIDRKDGSKPLTGFFILKGN
jgi:gliding motility-associated-like protein